MIHMAAFILIALVLWVLYSACMFRMFRPMGNIGNTILINPREALEEALGAIADHEDVAVVDIAVEVEEKGKPPPSVQEKADIWTNQVEPERYYKCINRSGKEKKRDQSNGYIKVHANGGLNQMKKGISDMVAVAKIMNATLILPTLDRTSFWKDSSNFKDIFDWRHFMEVLKDDINIVESLPSAIASMKPIRKITPTSWSKPKYYRDMVPLLRRDKVLHFTHTVSRLINNGMSAAIQRLRCRAMFDALRFTEDIEDLGNKLVDRLRNDGEPYIALHLRYEKDMLAFTGCDHNLTEYESKDLMATRLNVSHWKEKDIDNWEKRHRGGCPLMPRETALFLEGLGYPHSTRIYIVAGKIYGQEGIWPLRAKYPNLYNHFHLSTDEELTTFKDHPNKLAALDYVVAMKSNVFVYTFDGNMARAMKGHRKIEGFLKTICPHQPDFIKLVDRLDKGSVTKDQFSKKVKSMHIGRTGMPQQRQSGDGHMMKFEETFYANPHPGCICDRHARLSPDNKKLKP